MSLDFITGLLCTMAAFGLGVIHILTSRSRGNWDTWPQFVRVGVFSWAAFMLYRGVDLINLSSEPIGKPPFLGHIDLPGLGTTIAAAYTLCSLAYYFARKAYPEGVWRRLHQAQSLASFKFGGAVALLFMKGAHVAPPGAPLVIDDEAPIVVPNKPLIAP